MAVTLNSIVISLVVAAILSCVLRVLNWVWLRPKKLERLLREQGLKGNPYRLLYGDTKDMYTMAREARCKPINLSDDILPRILPYHCDTLQKHGKKSFSWIGPVPRVNIMDPELINEILVKNDIFKKPMQNPLHSLLVAGLGSYEDEKWAKHRKIVNPAFYLEKLKDMLPALYLCCNEMINKWEALVSSGKGSCEMDVWPSLHSLSCDVISRTAFGSSYEEGRRIFELQNEQTDLARHVFQSLYIPGWRFIPTKRTMRMKEIYREVQALVRNIINKRERAMKLGEAGDDDLLGMLLKSNLKEIKEHESKDAGMTIEEVIEECKVFYFAGQETTANLLVWTMVLLSMHPNWQARAREEVVQAFGNNTPDFDGLNRLKIVTMILNEVLRLYPPAMLLSRVIHQETKVGEMTLPAGVQFLVPIILVHHDREIWGDDAKEFKPERFSEGVAKATKNQASFIPFSWGPRICVGNNFATMEAKLSLSMILQHVSFELSPSYTHAPTFAVTLQPQNGAHMILRKL